MKLKKSKDSMMKTINFLLVCIVLQINNTNIAQEYIFKQELKQQALIADLSKDAIYYNLPENVKHLEESIKSNNHCEHHSLLYAVSKKLNTVIPLLVAAGADVNETTGQQNWTPIMIAASQNTNEPCSQLLHAGADITIVDKFGWSPLHYAARYDADITTSLLLAAHACVNQANHDGLTPLHIAVVKKSYKIVPLLLQADADVNIRDHFGWTPLLYAIYIHTYKMVPLLLAAGADVNQMNNIDINPIYAGAWSDTDKEIIDCLIGTKDHSKSMCTALHLAARCSADEIIPQLFDAGADRNKVDGDNKKAIDYATNQKTRNLLSKNSTCSIS